MLKVSVLPGILHLLLFLLLRFPLWRNYVLLCVLPLSAPYIYPVYSLTLAVLAVHHAGEVTAVRGSPGSFGDHGFYIPPRIIADTRFRGVTRSRASTRVSLLVARNVKRLFCLKETLLSLQLYNDNLRDDQSGGSEG